jgi:hypothetical protein
MFHKGLIKEQKVMLICVKVGDIQPEVCIKEDDEVEGEF